MLKLQLKQTKHYSLHLCKSNKTNNLLNCLTITKCWKHTHIMLFLISAFMLAQKHTKTSNV